MSCDLDKDIFAEQPYGKAALALMGPVHQDFRLFYAGWIGDEPSQWNTMEVRGAQFRRALRGANKGKLCIRVPGTTRAVFVSREEMDAAASCAMPSAPSAP